MNKYGVLKTTIALSLLCIIVSELIAAGSWYLAGLPNLGFLLFVAFLCPFFIAPVVIIAFCRLTENLQKSEEQYRSLFENASDLIQVVHPEGQFLYVNPSWCKTMGYTKDEALSLKIFDIIHPECADECSLHFGQTLAQGTSGTIESVFQSKEGNKVILSGSANTKYNIDGEPSFVHCIFKDITESRHMEDELIKMQKLESVGILAGGIAHDFNNLLTSILGNLSLAKVFSEEPKSKSYERIEEAEKATLRAKDLTQQLLTFSKGGDPVTTTISIKELIEDSCQFILRGSNVKCTSNISDNLSLVEVDEGQISQVIHNLLINANQAMPDGGLVKIHAKNINIGIENGFPLDEGGYVLITVEDQGVGISDKHLSKIFDPYFSTKHEGHGLGLATAYSIINKHDGLLAAESKLGEGTVFKIFLPASNKTETVQVHAQKDIRYGDGSILLMDDEEDVREIGAVMLGHLGYKVLTAEDGLEALEMYTKAYEEKTPFDIVVLDLTVPGGLGGKETLEKLKEIDPSVKAIVTSGYANDPIISNYKQYGFSGVLPKPYMIENVSKVLQDV